MTDRPPQLSALSPERKRALLAELMAKRGQTAGPLSYGQRALWFLWSLAPDSAAYNVLISWRVTAEVSPEGLEQALRGVVERHAVLRTTYPAVDGQPVRMVHASQAVALERVDASGWSDDELRARVAADADRPFDLQQGPVLRVGLYSRGQRDHVLAFTVHHIAFDDVSSRPLAGDFTALYSAARNGTAPPQSSNPGSYDDYVRWQSELVAGPEGNRLWEYWRTTLAGDIAPLTLPTDRPRPSAQTFNGRSFSFTLNSAVADGIVRLARQHETTPYVVTAAVFAVLLHRLSGQDDLLVGTPTAGRSRPEFSSTVGYFVNPVILRSSVSDDPAFADHIVRVRETVLGALDHGDFPFPLLVERLQPTRDASFSPLYQVGFVWDKVVRDEEAAGDLATTSWMAGQRGASADLGLTIFHDDRSMAGYWRYNTDLFDEETLRRFHGNFEILLAAAIARPDRRVSELPILTESERLRVVVEWNDTRAPDTGDLLHQLVERQAERTPEAVAVMFGDETLSYSELNSRANRLARVVRSHGVGPEVRVGIAMERSLEMVVSLLAVLKSGGAYVPLDPDYPRERLAYMLEDSGVSLLLIQERIRPALGDARVPIVAVDTNRAQIDTEPADNLSLPISPDHLAYVIYTSGSTGRPKGAMNAHRGIVNRLVWMQETYRLAVDERMLQKAPFSFDVSVWEFFWPLATGATLVMAPPGVHKDPEALVELIARLGITTLHFVPSMLQMFLQASGVERCVSLRRVFCGGEALSPAVRDALLSRTSAVLFNQYGPTETAVDVTYWPCVSGADAPIPIGVPGANTQLYVMDRRLQLVPTGASGELCIGGVQVGRGYLGRPALTAERFVPDPFNSIPGSRLYRTGDRSRHRRDGAVEFLGRFDDQVKLRGIRIELGEIEAALLKHPAVAAAAVIVRDEGDDDKRLVAYLVARGEQPPVEDVRRFLLTSLPEYMAPATTVFLESLPMTASGKLDRRALPAPPAHRDSPSTSAPVAPRTATEELVCRIWAEVLKVDSVGVRDNFFELGGHSLLATKVMSRLRAATGADLPLRAFFENATVEGLATAVVQHQARLADEDTLAKLLAEVE
jgi:amino acid adenylation domain-containing protein